MSHPALFLYRSVFTPIPPATVILSCTDLWPPKSIPLVSLFPSFLSEYQLLTTEIRELAVSFFFNVLMFTTVFLMSLRKLPFLTKFCCLHFHQWKKYPPNIPKLLLDIVQLCAIFKHCCFTLQQGNAWPVSPAMCWSQWHCIQSHRNLILQSWFCSHPELQLLPAAKESLQIKRQGWNSPASYQQDSHWLTWLQCCCRLSQLRSHLTGTALLWHKAMPMFGALAKLLPHRGLQRAPKRHQKKLPQVSKGTVVL